MLISGKWIDRDNKIKVHDPYDNKVIDTIPKATAKDVEEAVRSAERGFLISKIMPVHKRFSILLKAADIIESKHEDFARTIASEGSKTIKEARKEVSRALNTLRWSAEESKRLFGETLPFDSFPGGENKFGYYYRMPVGIILAITPFNDPLNLVVHKLGPAIAGGNSVILKPATVTPLAALKFAEALLEAGLPPEILNVVTGSGREIGAQLLPDERIRMISFTGGVEAGKEITRLAGIKKIGMELGSNTPNIVWEDADIDNAVESCVDGSFGAAGQNCIGVQRLYIHESVYREFKDKFISLTKSYKIGDKLLEETDMGPMITEHEARRVEDWIKEAVDKGAKILTGGKRNGTMVEPTVLEEVPEDATIHKEEVFGPVVNFYRITDFDDAINRANSLPYGLHAGIFTNDVDLALKASLGLDCGGVMINNSSDYRLDPMPFGGIKYSGLGREGIKFSLQEMTEPKVVCFNMKKIE